MRGEGREGGGGDHSPEHAFRLFFVISVLLTSGTPFQTPPSSQMDSVCLPCQGPALEMAEMPPATQHEKLQPPGAASRLQQPFPQAVPHR